MRCERGEREIGEDEDPLGRMDAAKAGSLRSPPPHKSTNLGPREH